MSVDLKVLKAHDLTSDKLKPQFAKGKTTEKITKLVDYLRDVLREGLEHNCKEARIYFAIDKSYDVSFRQTSYTLAAHLVDQSPSPDVVESTVRDLGLTHLMVPWCPDCKGAVCKTTCSGKSRTLRLNNPLLKQLYVPLVKSYVKRAWAKMFNDRDTVPHYAYAPRRLTLKDKIQCDLISEQIDIMAANCGYREDRAQAYLNALLYGICLGFPRKSWHKQVQIRMDDGKEKEEIQWEGVLNTFPHPSKFFYDPAFRPCTLNSDTGCRYAGYWDICRWSEINNDPAYWNKDQVGFNEGDWFTKLPNQTYMNLYPCVMKWPTTTQDTNDREKRVGEYGTATDAQAAFVRTNLFMKLKPSDYGLGDGKYEHDVWFRFVIGATDTVLFVEPYAYSPVIYYGTEADGNRIRNSSMALDCLPFQDHLGNLFTQMLLQIQKNLISVVFWNKDIVVASDIEAIKNIGDKMFQGIHFLEYSEDETRNRLKENVGEAFHPLIFPQHPIGEGLTMVNMLLNILERVLAFSSQEVGVSSSHQISANENATISASTDNRTKFTESFIDNAERADKRRLYDAWKAYGKENIKAQIVGLTDDKKKALKELGFKIDEEPSGTETHASISGPKSKLDIDEFAFVGEPDSKASVGPVISGIATILTGYMNNPIMLQAVGPEQITQWTNKILELTGIEGFEMRVVNKPQMAPQGEELQKLIADISQKISGANSQELMKAIGENALKPMEEQLKVLAQQLQQVGQAVAPIGQAVQQLGPAVQQLGQVAQQQQAGLQALAQKNQENDLINVEQTKAIQRLDQMIKGAEMQGPSLPTPEQLLEQGNVPPQNELMPLQTA